MQLDADKSTHPYSKSLKKHSMHLKLSITSANHKEDTFRAYDTDLDDVRSILIDACRLLEDHTVFLVSGFGQDKWPVDTGTDLPVFLEQLPGVLKALKNMKETEIDFYEQGIERTIRLTPSDTEGNYSAHCTSRLDWTPDPDCEPMDRDTLLEMLSAILNDFILSITQLSPSIIGHPWIKSWKET